MRKRILIAVTIAAIVGCFAFTACGTEKSAAIGFDEKFAAVTAPVTLASMDAINAAYDEYYLLAEEARSGLEEKKTKLDGYAALCGALLAVVENAEKIGEYTAFTAYEKRVNAAAASYDALIALDDSYASDADVTAAKKLIDAANETVAAKKALITAYLAAVELVGEYDAQNTLYTDWAANIAAAQKAYEALGGTGDDMVTLPDVAAARLKLKTHAAEKETLSAVIADLETKVAAAKKVYSETFADGEPSYSAAVNAAFDAAELALSAATALNLTADAATETARGELAALNALYDGIRYPYEFADLMSSVAADMAFPSKYDALSETLAKAEITYGRIPAAQRESVADSKAVFDAAKAKLPELAAQKAFLDAVAKIDLAAAVDIAAVKTLIAEAEAEYAALVADYAYAGGVGEVDKAKANLDGDATDCAAAEAFMKAVDKLPDDITNTRENYDALLAAENLYAGMTDAQRSLALVKTAYIRFYGANETFRSHMKAMFATEAKYASGEIVEPGMKVFPIDETGGLITPDGALANYLQVLYTVSAVLPEGVVANGKAPAADGSNVADVDFDAYISENFEYVYTIYDPATDKKLGTIAKPLHYDAADDQVPTLAELQALLPVYYGEATTRSYYYTLAVRVRGTGSDIGCLILDAPAVRCEGQGTVEGSAATANQLSNENMVTLESPDTPAGVIQWGRNGTVRCANGKFLAHPAVGAFDIYFYKGESTDEANLIDWARVVKNPVNKKYVKTYLGSSLAAKFPDLDVKTAAEYTAAEVTDITDVGYLASTKRGWIVDKKDNASTIRLSLTAYLTAILPNPCVGNSPYKSDNVKSGGLTYGSPLRL